MSFLSHSKTTDNNNNTNNDETEMTQIINLDSFMSLMDSRNSLEHFTQTLQDDNSSISSEDTIRMSSKEEEPQGHVFYQYSSDDEEDAHFQGEDEAEQSLVGRDIEAIGTSKNMDNSIRVNIYIRSR
jgi:hypothetical protein